MNHLNTAICETDTGDILILWGGRRIVTRMLVPGLLETFAEEQMGIPVEHVWVRRYRLDSGPLVLTRIYDNGRKRVDYNAVGFGRNPAIIKDRYGRLWVGYRIPIISTQDPFGALSSEYVNPQNVGTTAGMNFWQMVRADDVSKFRGAWPWSGAAWQEQVELTAPPVIPEGGVTPDLADMSIDELIDYLQKASGDISGAFTDEGGSGWNMFSDFTEDRLSGRLMFRGQGGNEMDEKNITRWKWNEAEGLSRTWSACDMLNSGQQIRLRGRSIEVALQTDWNKGSRLFRVTSGDYGVSGNLRVDRFGNIWTAGKENIWLGEIPFQVENESGVKTIRPATPKAGEDTTQYDDWVAKQVEYAAAWAQDNEKDWVLDNADVPGEGYSKDVTPPTPEEQAAETKTLTGYYYKLPIYAQRPGYCISRNGLQYISYLCGNLMAKPVEVEGKTAGYKAVGLRVSVSRDGGKSFEPLIPERIGYLNHAEVN